MKSVESKREREKEIVGQMIALYCHGNHGTPSKGPLCPECAELRAYAESRSDHCPFMENKTFCVNCPVHCYKPSMREKICVVMRYSGPRMIFHHPIVAIHHLISTKQEQRRLRKEGKLPTQSQ